MNIWKISLIAGTVVLVAGCHSHITSISQPRPVNASTVCARPGYVGVDAPASAEGYVNPAFAYRGELSEFDVLGISRGGLATEAEINQALDAARTVRLKPGAPILLIQSGATFPDPAMVSELSRHFKVVPFSGVPASPGWSGASRLHRNASEAFANGLRLAAARAGSETILCYWGMLESEQQDLPTKTVSWVPLLGWVVPDENQHDRMRLKMALIDVRTGNWSMFSPEAIENSHSSTSEHRERADQKQIEALKTRAYSACVTALVNDKALVAE